MSVRNAAREGASHTYIRHIAAQRICSEGGAMNATARSLIATTAEHSVKTSTRTEGDSRDGGGHAQVRVHGLDLRPMRAILWAVLQHVRAVRHVR